MIARLAVQTGLPPGDLLAADARLYDELAAAAAERWTVLEELAAQQLEVLHALFRTYLQVHSKKGSLLPEPLVVPRPGVEPPRPRRVSPREFAQSFASRRRRVG